MYLRSLAYFRFVIAGLLALATASCRRTVAEAGPTIEVTRVPPAGAGSPVVLDTIEGRVNGARPGQKVVLFAAAGAWWVQPMGSQPFTEIQKDLTWKSSTHPGSAYAALLVDSAYRPPMTIRALPEKGEHVLAVTVVRGAAPKSAPKTVSFSGYQWEIRETPSEQGGSTNEYDPANAWRDEQGFLHLRIAKQGDHWTSSEIKLARSLGYGSYRFVVRDVAHLEPSAVFSLLTYDDYGPSREMDIEMSRWGAPEKKNAQYVVQPYVVPANVVRFSAPAGALTYWMIWQPERVTFKTVRGVSGTQAPAIAEHTFLSGVPSPGSERIHMMLYVFKAGAAPLEHETEVVLEKFEFLP